MAVAATRYTGVAAASGLRNAPSTCVRQGSARVLRRLRCPDLHPAAQAAAAGAYIRAASGWGRRSESRGAGGVSSRGG